MGNQIGAIGRPPTENAFRHPMQHPLFYMIGNADIATAPSHFLLAHFIGDEGGKPCLGRLKQPAVLQLVSQRREVELCSA